MPEHGIDRAMLAPEPKRDHGVLRNRLKSLTPLEGGDRRSVAHVVPLQDSINYSAAVITRFRPHHYSRSTYMVIFNPLESQIEENSKSPTPESKVLIIRPELHGHEHDHVLRVQQDKVEEMLQEFEKDQHSPKFRPQKLTSKKPEDIQRHKLKTTEQNSQILALLRLLQSALEQTPQDAQ